MSIPVVGGFGTPDPDAAPTTLTQLITQLNALLTLSIDETITPYILGNDVPGVDDQDKVWYRIDDMGRPFGAYVFWNGLWVLPPPPLASQIGFWAGDPTVNFDANGTGVAGPGPVANETFGWQIMNGFGGTTNISDRFLVGARVDNVGITGWDPVTRMWLTNITGEPLGAGGESTITLDQDTTYRPATDAVEVGKHDATGSSGSGGPLYGASDSDNFNLVDADAGNESPDSISIVNPFAAVAMLQWIGYS